MSVTVLIIILMQRDHDCLHVYCILGYLCLTGTCTLILSDDTNSDAEKFYRELCDNIHVLITAFLLNRLQWMPECHAGVLNTDLCYITEKRKILRAQKPAKWPMI